MALSESAAIDSGARLTSETLAAKWAEIASQALLVVAVPRALGPSSYGEFAVAFAAVSSVSLGLGLGAPLAAVRYLPATAPHERLARARAVAQSVAVSRARILGVLTAAAVALGPTLLGVPLSVTLVVCAAAWFSVGSSVASELGLALGRPRMWNTRFPLENGLIVLAAPAGHAAGGATGAIVGMALACAVTFAVLATPLVADLRGVLAGEALPAGAVSYARLETVSVVVGTLINRGGPLAVALAGASAAQIGFAAIATGVGAAGAATMIDLLIVQVPRLVEVWERAPARADREAARTARTALLVAIATALPAALLAGPAIQLALGSTFAGAREAVVIALASVPLGAVAGLATVMASLRLRPRALALAWTIGGLVFAAVAAAAIPGLAATGAALAMSSGLLAAVLAATVLIGGRQLRSVLLAAVASAAGVLAVGALAG